MKCAVHPDADAIGYCRNCGKALCSVCARPIRDVYYCEDCLAGAVGIPPNSPPATPYAPGPTPYVAAAGPTTQRSSAACTHCEQPYNRVHTGILSRPRRYLQR
jgi:hypothetical protein